MEFAAHVSDDSLGLRERRTYYDIIQLSPSEYRKTFYAQVEFLRPILDGTRYTFGTLIPSSTKQHIYCDLLRLIHHTFQEREKVEEARGQHDSWPHEGSRRYFQDKLDYILHQNFIWTLDRKRFIAYKEGFEQNNRLDRVAFTVDPLILPESQIHELLGENRALIKEHKDKIKQYEDEINKLEEHLAKIIDEEQGESEQEN